MKTCSKCKLQKPLNEFDCQASNKDGRRPSCRVCSRSTLKSWRDRNPQKVKENNKIYRETNSEKAKEAHKAWLKANPSRIKARSLKKYWPNLSTNEALDEYNRLCEAQQHSCAVCLTPRSSLNKDLSVDHCHTSGRVRGLLCIHCNLALGHSKESINILMLLIEYLNKHKE